MNSVALQTRTKVAELLTREIQNPHPSDSDETIAQLVNCMRKGHARIVLELIKGYFKRGSEEEQLCMVSVLDRCLINTGAQFAVMLSNEKWTDRFFRVAKDTPSQKVRIAIITTAIGWNKQYRTTGLQRLMHRYEKSKVLGVFFRQCSLQYEEQHQSSHLRALRESQHFNNMTDDTPHRVLGAGDMFLMDCGSDLAALEYALENPNAVDCEALVKNCKQRLRECWQMLESGDWDRMTDELTSTMCKLSEGIELYEAINNPEEKLSGDQVTTDDEFASPDSDDDELQRRLRARAVAKQSPSTAVADIQKQTHALLEQEHAEKLQLRKQLEALTLKKEEIENKYKDAKVKNQQLIAVLEHADEQKKLLGGTEVGPPVGKPGLRRVTAPCAGPAPASASLEQLRKMQATAQSLRSSLNRLRGHTRTEIVEASRSLATEIQSAFLTALQADEKKRQTDQRTLAWTQELYKKEIMLRKQYYNTIQDMKGNIRVYCRVRPMLPNELKGKDSSIMSFPSTDKLKFIDAAGREKSFEFDEVYAPDVQQSKVFQDTAPLIDSVVDGYNVCIFAYGQTGSGKTFTMGGGEGDDKGINARALERLFAIIAERKDTETSTVTVSVLEIYCEQIRDLLVEPCEMQGITYEVKQGGPYGTYVTNLKEMQVRSASEVHATLNLAQRNRTEGSTNMNEHSSRSHMLLYVVVRTVNNQTKLQSYGKLSLVDLAGSERVDRSGAEGQQLKEAVSINLSLSSLGDVIAGLAQHNKHIPFRNSVLTFLLQDSMAGQAKVLMFVCVSPSSSNCNESSSSLQFASRTRGVALGKVSKNPATEAK